MNRPPLVLRTLLRWCLHPIDADVVLGDLEETYAALARRYGVREARRWYRRQVVRSVPPFLSRSFLWSTVMLKSYLKIAFRSLRKQKVYGSINVLGLAIGLALCLLIALFVRDELTYDRFHEHADRLYRVNDVRMGADGAPSDNNRNTAIPLGSALAEELPAIEAVARLFDTRHFVRTGQTPLEADVLYADPAFFEMFSFPMVRSGAGDPLAGPADVVVTEAAAVRFYGTTDAVGKTLPIRVGADYVDYVVAGVAGAVPSNSSIRFDVVLPFMQLLEHDEGLRGLRDAWGGSVVETFVMLAEPGLEETLHAPLDGFYRRYHGGYLDRLRERHSLSAEVQPASYRLRNIRDVHLSENSDPTYSYILSGIALAILLIACINFMTLAIGRSAGRAREVGIRKVVGAHRTQVMGQFWGESFVMTGVAVVVGVALAGGMLPLFNELAAKDLRLDGLADGVLLAVVAGLLLVTGLVAGSYPALVLSGLRPIDSLQRRLRMGGANGFTRTLVVVQFGLSVFLIAGTIIMHRQMDYLKNKNLGFDREHVVVLPTKSLDGRAVAGRLRQDLAGRPEVLGVTAAGLGLGWRGSSGVRYEHEGRSYNINLFGVESDYFEFLDLEVVAGRPLDPSRATDTTEAVIVNEALVRQFEIEDPIGKEIPGFDLIGETPPRIVGVVEDFHFNTLYQEVNPALFSLHDFWGLEVAYVRVAPDDVPGALAAIEAAWEGAVPDVPFRYSFLDDDLERTYASDQRWSRIVRYAALFAVFIACLGLFGLATLAAASRSKEVGIRKVLGASSGRIVWLLAREFLVLVLLGSALAAPVAYLAMGAWLQDFAFRITPDPLYIAGAGLVAALVAGLTVGYHAFQSARANPVDSLRYE